MVHRGALEYLSEVKELRLEGNRLCSVPWAVFRATLGPRVLDLMHYRTDMHPGLAL